MEVESEHEDAKVAVAVVEVVNSAAMVHASREAAVGGEIANEDEGEMNFEDVNAEEAEVAENAAVRNAHVETGHGDANVGAVAGADADVGVNGDEDEDANANVDVDDVDEHGGECADEAEAESVHELAVEEAPAGAVIAREHEDEDAEEVENSSYSNCFGTCVVNVLETDSVGDYGATARHGGMIGTWYAKGAEVSPMWVRMTMKQDLETRTSS